MDEHEGEPPRLPPSTGFKHADGHSHHLGGKHEAADERTMGITLTGPMQTEDGVCWYAESALDPDLHAHADTPGMALTMLGDKLDTYLAAEGWKAVHGG